MNFYSLTIKEASSKLAKGEITSVELTKSIFERIKAVEPKVGAYITLCEEKALDMARSSDERRKAGKILSEIDGIPVGVKDVVSTRDILTTAASKILSDYIPSYNATVYDKLEKAGCVLVGKTNLDEFAMGSSTENSAYKISHLGGVGTPSTSEVSDLIKGVGTPSTSEAAATRNPWDLERVPGGSSGGSAAAVAADECLFAIGTDTGGSIRQPSSFCSTVGMKVSYGLVSRYGVVSYASSFDTIGPITKTVEDSAIVLKYIAGNDPKDATSVQEEIPDYTQFLKSDLKGKRIGLPKEYFGEGLDPEVAGIIEKAKKTLIELGAQVEEISLPLTKYAIAVYYILVKSEASSNLSRYDGIHYGLSTIKERGTKDREQTLEEVYLRSRSEGFGPEPKRSIMLGAYTLSAGYFDAYYKKAAKVRTEIKKELEEMLKKYDVLIAPVSPFSAFKLGEKLNDPLSMYLADVDTAPINIAGVPAMSVPAGFTGNGLPIGLQIIGPMHGESKIYEVASAFEKATKWHKAKPQI